MKVDNFNFTGRKNIPNKFINISKERDEDQTEIELILKVELEPRFLSKITDDQGVYIDAVAGSYRLREELSKEKSQTISFDLSKARVVPKTFRITVLDKENQNLRGNIIQSGYLTLSRTEIDLENDDQPTGSKKRNFIEPVPADLGNVIWKLNWSNDDVVWEMNRKLHEIYLADSSNPLFMATCIPQLIKEVFKDIFSRFQDLSDLRGLVQCEEWINWSRYIASVGEVEFPAVPFKDENGNVNDQWDTFLEDVVDTYSGLPFRNGHNLLEMLVNEL